MNKYKYHKAKNVFRGRRANNPPIELPSLLKMSTNLRDPVFLSYRKSVVLNVFFEYYFKDKNRTNKCWRTVGSSVSPLTLSHCCVSLKSKHTGNYYDYLLIMLWSGYHYQKQIRDVNRSDSGMKCSCEGSRSLGNFLKYSVCFQRPCLPCTHTSGCAVPIIICLKWQLTHRLHVRNIPQALLAL